MSRNVKTRLKTATLTGIIRPKHLPCFHPNVLNNMFISSYAVTVWDQKIKKISNNDQKFNKILMTSSPFSRLQALVNNSPISLE